MMSLHTENKQLIGKKINSSHSIKVAFRIGVKLAPLLILTLCGFAYEQLFHTYSCTGLVEVPSENNGLVGAPVDPRYAQTSEVGLLTDYAYICLMKTVSHLSALSFLPSIFIAVKICLKNQYSEATKFFLALLVLIGIPLLVHSIGTSAITIYDEIGGGHRTCQPTIK